MNLFDRVVVAAIGVNTATVAWSIASGMEWVSDAYENIAERIDLALLAFFVVEITLRVRRAGRSFYRDRWLLFDTAVIAVALLPVGAASISALRVVRAARLVHFSRHFPHLQHITGVRVTHLLETASS